MTEADHYKKKLKKEGKAALLQGIEQVQKVVVKEGMLYIYNVLFLVQFLKRN